MNEIRDSSENRQIELLGYLPEFLKGFRELKAVFSAEDPELSEIKKAVNTSRNAAFIAHCNNAGLSRFERMMGIYAAENEEISERRQRVLIRWNEAPPYTMAALNSKLAAICGEGNFSVVRELAEYKITVFTSRLQGRQLDELSRMLSMICPANLIVKIENSAVIESSQNVSAGGLSVFSTVICA